MAVSYLLYFCFLNRSVASISYCALSPCRYHSPSLLPLPPARLAARIPWTWYSYIGRIIIYRIANKKITIVLHVSRNGANLGIVPRKYLCMYIILRLYEMFKILFQTFFNAHVSCEMFSFLRNCVQFRDNTRYLMYKK